MAQGPDRRMNWLRKKVLALGLKMAGITVNTTSPELFRFFGASTASGKTVNDESALQVSTVWSCVRILAETIGSLPWGIYRKDRKGNAEKIDHRVAEVLVGTPNEEMTSQEFRECEMLNLVLRGNGYAIIERTGKNISSLQPVPAAQVEPKRENDGRLVYRINDRGKWQPFPAEKVFHLKGFGSNGLVGLSPLSYARESMGITLGQMEAAAKMFAQGLRPSATLKFPQWLTDEQRQKARENITKIYEGSQNAGKVFLVEGGMEIEPWSMTPDDAQFVELFGWSVDDICRFFRVPPHMVAKLDRATFSNIEQLSLEFVTFTLLPYFVRWEQAVQKRLLAPGERGEVFLRFNFEGLLRADTNARANLYASGLQNGYLNRNEVRALENLNSVPGLDDYTVQSNMTLIQLLEQLTRANAQRQGTPA